MRSSRLAVLYATLVVFGCGPSTGSSSGSGAGTSGAGTSGSDETTSDSVSASGAADGSSTDAVDPQPKYDVAPVEPPGPPADACGLMPPADCAPTWAADDNLSVDGVASSAEILADALEIRLARMPGDEEIGTLGFELPCPQAAGAPKADITRFEVPGRLEVYLPGRFEYTWVATYAVVVDAEFHNACVHVQVHDIEVDPAPIEPTDGEPFAWPALAEPGWVWIEG